MDHVCYNCNSVNIDSRIETVEKGFDVEITYCRDCGSIISEEGKGEYLELKTQFHDSIGYKIHLIIDELRIYRYFLDMNLRDLLRGISLYSIVQTNLESGF